MSLLILDYNFKLFFWNIRLKRITVSLQIGIINSNKNLFNPFIKYLEEKSLSKGKPQETSKHKEYNEYLVIYENIPIKLKINLLKSFNDLMNNYEKTKGIDVVILLTEQDKESLSGLSKKQLKEVDELLLSSVSFVLVQMETSSDSKNIINEHDLIHKAKKLDVRYLFTIKPHHTEINQIFTKILDDFILKFKFLNPELFEKAKAYGIQISKKKRERGLI
jgi:hypothetical protein